MIVFVGIFFYAMFVQVWSTLIANEEGEAAGWTVRLFLSAMPFILLFFSKSSFTPFLGLWKSFRGK